MPDDLKTRLYQPTSADFSQVAPRRHLRLLRRSMQHVAFPTLLGRLSFWAPGRLPFAAFPGRFAVHRRWHYRLHNPFYAGHLHFCGYSHTSSMPLMQRSLTSRRLRSHGDHGWATPHSPPAFFNPTVNRTEPPYQICQILILDSHKSILHS